jgi:hypothetical protein
MCQSCVDTIHSTIPADTTPSSDPVTPHIAQMSPLSRHHHTSQSNFDEAEGKYELMAHMFPPM